MATATCARCGLFCTVTYSARGTERRHQHKCSHGNPCTYTYSPLSTNKDEPSCEQCRHDKAMGAQP